MSPMTVTKHTEFQDEVLTKLLSRINDKTAQVGIVGLGYVGLPLCLLFAGEGFHTTGFDIDPTKVAQLRQGRSYIKHISAEEISAAVQGNFFSPETDFAKLREMDAIIVCVPTPLDGHREPDLTYITATTESISSYLRRGQLVVLESTTYPGTTEEVVLPALERFGLRCPISPYTVSDNGVDAHDAGTLDFLLAFSPEREDPGNKLFKTQQVPKVVGGVNASSALAAQALYSAIISQTVLVSSTRAAEMTKLLENIYRSVNIALVNELKLLCLRMGLNIWEIIDAAKTKPFGFSAFYPGPGLGGHCIPIDPFYLTWKAREYEFPTRFIELAGEINSSMPEHVVQAMAQALNGHAKCLRGAKVLVLGVAYKKDVDDLRESPSLEIMELLQSQGASVEYHDPYCPHLGKMRHHDFQLSSVEISEETLPQYDAVLIATDHSCLDYEFVVRHATLVVDARNATRNVREHREKVFHC